MSGLRLDAVGNDMVALQYDGCDIVHIHIDRDDAILRLSVFEGTNDEADVKHRLTVLIDHEEDWE